MLMVNLLASISSVDPPSLLAWLVLAFAAGMYPVGIMLGSTCSPCCPPANPCNIDLSTTTEVHVEITASNVLLQETRVYAQATMKVSQAGDMSHLEGTHILEKIGAIGSWVLWRKSIASPTTNCQSAVLEVELFNNPSVSFNFSYFNLRVTGIRMPSRRSWDYDGCGAPQYYDGTSLTECKNVFNVPCTEDLIASTSPQVFSATCGINGFLNLPPYSLTINKAGHGVPSNWTFVSVTTDEDNLNSAIVIDDVVITRP
jgi:hypothetical protein